MDVSKIPNNVLSDLRERGHDDQGIAVMSPEEAFEEYCTWHGVINWGRTFVEALDGLRAAASPPESAQDKLLREARAAFAVITNNSNEPHINAFASEWFKALLQPPAQAVKLIPANTMDPVASNGMGFVLALPGASSVQRDEIVALLREGGNDVRFVEEEDEARVLGKIANQASLERDDASPSMPN